MRRAHVLLGCGGLVLLAAPLVLIWLAGGFAHDECPAGHVESGPGPPPHREPHPIPGGAALALGLGGNKSCSVMKGGRVYCWGDDGKYPASSNPGLLTDVLNRAPEEAKAMAQQESRYGCALSRREVRCWDLTDGRRSGDTPSPPGKDFAELWVGPRSACAKHGGGAVECWGGKPWTDDGESLAPIRYQGLQDADDMIIRESEVWVRRRQTVARFQLRRELDALRAAPTDSAHSGFQSSEVVQCGKARCARLTVDTDGPIACWSEASHSLRVQAQLGIALSFSVSDGKLCARGRPDEPKCASCDELLGAPDRGSANRSTPCVVQASGTVLCESSFVPEGNGLVVRNAPAHHLAGVTDAVDVFTDSGEVCVKRRDKDWGCWPTLNEGQAIAQLSSAWQLPSPPRSVAEATGATAVAVNRFAMCFKDAQSKATCFARTPEGALRTPTSLPDARQVAVGSAHACAVGNDDSLRCWGANESGQAAGKADPGWVSSPALVLSGVADVAVGLRHTCAVVRDRGVVCFGDNHLGQLGPGTPTDAAGMVSVSGISPAPTKVVAALVDTCALTAAGTVFCWGALDRAQVPRQAYQVVGFQTPALQLAAGGDRVCALLSDRTVACWRGYQAIPTPVPGTEGSVEVAVGDDHGCVRNADGNVRCWGSNEFGQLGLDAKVTRDEIRPPHSCPQVTYAVESRWDTPQDVIW